jgi:hypothetical protein
LSVLPAGKRTRDFLRTPRKSSQDIVNRGKPQLHQTPACGAAGGTSFSSSGTIALIQEASEVASLGFSSHPKNIDVTEVFTLTSTTACGFDETGFLTWSDQF